MSKNNSNARSKKTKETVAKPVKIYDMDLVAYLLNCSHLGREFGVKKGDVIFCKECNQISRVSKVLAK
jgi:hypothetical protein